MEIIEATNMRTKKRKPARLLFRKADKSRARARIKAKARSKNKRLTLMLMSNKSRKTTRQ